MIGLFVWYSEMTSLLTINVRGYQISIAYCLFSFLIGSSSILQVTRTTIKACMSLNLGRILPLTSELAALEHLKNII